MRTKNQAMQLIKLARHLMETELTDEDRALIQDLKQERSSDNYMCFPFVLKALPMLFEEWEEWPECGLIVFKPKPDRVTDDVTPAIILYFGLNQYQFEHLFIAGKQRAQYGGKVLISSSAPREVAQNIFHFLDKTWVLKILFFSNAEIFLLVYLSMKKCGFRDVNQLIIKACCVWSAAQKVQFQKNIPNEYRGNTRKETYVLQSHNKNERLRSEVDFANAIPTQKRLMRN